MQLLTANWSDWTPPDVMVSLVPLLCIPAFFLWRASRRSRRLVFRAAAGPLLSIAVGLSAQLAMVVTFSGFEMDGRSVHAWRELLIWLRGLTEIPTAVWIGSYLILAGIGVSVALRSGVARSGLRTMGRPGEAVRRADKGLSVLHKTLMGVTLFALAIPTIKPAARRQLRWQYRVALQEQVDAEGQFNAAAFLTQQIAHETREAQAGFGELIDRVSERASDGERHAAVARLAEEHAQLVLGQLPLLEVQARDLSQPLPEETEFVAPLRGFADAERRLADVEDEQARATQDQESVSPAIDRLARASTAAATALFSVHPSDEYVAFGAAVCADYLGRFLEALSKGGFAKIARLGHLPSHRRWSFSSSVGSSSRSRSRSRPRRPRWTESSHIWRWDRWYRCRVHPPLNAIPAESTRSSTNAWRPSSATSRRDARDWCRGSALEPDDARRPGVARGLLRPCAGRVEEGEAELAGDGASRATRARSACRHFGRLLGRPPH